MKKLKYILIGLCILVIILVIIIIETNGKKNYEENVIQTSDTSMYGTEKVSFVYYSIVKDCLQQYINELNIKSFKYLNRDSNGNYVDNTDEAEKKQNIYNLLSKDYIEENNITIENLNNFIKTTTVEKEIVPYKVVRIATKEEDLNTENYYISAILFEEDNIEEFDKIYAIVNLDIINGTFSIRPLKEEKELENFKVPNTSSIEVKNNNIYLSREITDQKIATEYFTNYKYLLLTDVELAFNNLNKDYMEKRFGNLQSFKEYVNNNREIFKEMTIEKYQVTSNENNVEYICVDQYDNIYMFYEEFALEYTVVLDMYTLDIPQLNEKYDETNEKGKCILNIEKIEQALNSGDYKYIYGKLNEQFKNKNYSTLSTFENYMKSNLNKYNKIEYKEFKNEGETYIYNVELTDLLGKTDKTINMQILMQLKDDRDFVMSFSIK